MAARKMSHHTTASTNRRMMATTIHHMPAFYHPRMKKASDWRQVVPNHVFTHGNMLRTIPAKNQAMHAPPRPTTVQEIASTLADNRRLSDTNATRSATNATGMANRHSVDQSVYGLLYGSGRESWCARRKPNARNAAIKQTVNTKTTSVASPPWTPVGRGDS